MSFESAAESAPKAREPAARPAEQPGAPKPPAPRFGKRAGLLVVLGGLAVGGIATVALTPESGAPSGFELQQIAATDVGDASQSLVGADAADLVSEAKSCRAPLAYLVIQPTGAPGGTVRFHSGAYTSANIRLNGHPVRVALPFPAPYATGHGQIFMDNGSGGANVFLKPGFTAGTASGPAVINVHWVPKSAC